MKLLGLLILVSAPVWGDETQALDLLLGMANEPMKMASCTKARPDGTVYKFKEDLATYFSAFDKGENRVAGKCFSGQCSVEISHRDGEDLFSAIYRFKLSGKGAVVRNSMECIWTP